MNLLININSKLENINSLRLAMAQQLFNSIAKHILENVNYLPQFYTPDESWSTDTFLVYYLKVLFKNNGLTVDVVFKSSTRQYGLRLSGWTPSPVPFKQNVYTLEPLGIDENIPEDAFDKDC
jgi:hypothetical protein